MKCCDKILLIALSLGVVGVHAADRGAPGDEGLFPFVIRPDAENAALDMSALLSAPAGRDGFIRCEGEHLVNGKGERVRLNGINLTGRGNFPAHGEADRLAAQFARLGFNCVRLHLFDAFDYSNPRQSSMPCLFRRVPSGKATVIDPQQLDRLEYMIAAFKKRGIHINMNLHAARTLGPADGIRASGKYSRGVNYYVRELIEAEKQYAREILTHVNPYTGLSLADDPTMALVDLNNENGLMPTYWSGGLKRKSVDPWYLEEFDRQRVAAGYNATTNGINKFIIETERNYFREMIGYLKEELGVKCPIYGTQQDYAATWVLAETGDVVDTHVYTQGGHADWAEPSGADGLQRPESRWSAVMRSLVEATLNNGWEMEHSIVRRGARRVAGRPFVVSECSEPYPGWYGAEFQPTIHAYAAFQDWAGVFAYSWNNEANAFPEFNPYCFSHAARPDTVAHFPAACAMFLRGDVAKAKRRIEVPVDVRTRLRMAEKPYTPTSVIYAPLIVIDTESSTGGKVPNAAVLKHGVAVDLKEGPVPEPPVVVCATNGTIVSDTKEITLHRAEDKSGWFSVDVPNVKHLSGFACSRRFDLGGVVFEPGPAKLGWCAVSLVDQKGTGMRQGSRLLLSVTGYTHNGGAVYHHLDGDTWGGKVSELGTGKVVTEGVPLKLTLPVGGARCWALDETGARKSSVDVTSQGDGSVIAVGPQYRTVWYEIQL